MNCYKPWLGNGVNLGLRDIVPKVNRPHLRYKYETDRLAMEPAYEDLAKYLHPEARDAP